VGTIGFAVARRIDAGLPGIVLEAVAARDEGKARQRLAVLKRPVDVVPFAMLAERSDVVVEAMPARVFAELAREVIARGKVLVALTVAALLEHPELIDQAAETEARIVVPSGALLGLDGVRAAAHGKIASVCLVTRKPPAGLAGAPYLVERGISLEGLAEPLKVFDGTAREGARGFPANVNVAAALSLAGIGADRTRLEIWADPTVVRNTHQIEVESDSGRFSIKIEGIPSEENPRTGKLTAQSVIDTLVGLNATLRVGS
jgi:aspartate dehydrogenase